MRAELCFGKVIGCNEGKGLAVGDVWRPEELSGGSSVL